MKAPRILPLTVTGLVALLTVASAFSKLTHHAAVVAALTKTGVGPYVTLLGIAQLLFTALFLYPKTLKLGFALLSCYYAGAMAAELSHGGPVLNAAVPLALLWLAAFLRDRTVFRTTVPTVPVGG